MRWKLYYLGKNLKFEFWDLNFQLGRCLGQNQVFEFGLARFLSKLVLQLLVFAVDITTVGVVVLTLKIVAVAVICYLLISIIIDVVCIMLLKLLFFYCRLLSYCTQVEGENIDRLGQILVWVGEAYIGPNLGRSCLEKTGYWKGRMGRAELGFGVI